MRAAILATALLLLVNSLGLTQAFQQDGNVFVLRQGQEYIRFERGVWFAGIEGVRGVSWTMFLWHDNWVYETLQGGAVEAGPALQPDGSLTMTGAFSAREGSAPVKYALWMTPSPEGVRVRCELEKTAELKLTNGVWLHVSPEPNQFTGTERVWGRPSWHSTVSGGGNGVVDAFFVELRDGRSLCLIPADYRQAEKETFGGPSYTFRLNVLPGDFEFGEKRVIEYTISFGDMPAEFPGEVRPMHERLAIRGAKANALAVPVYDRLELAVDLGATYDNPYDPDEVALDARFTSPSGERITVPGFFMLDYRREIREGNELMIPAGGSGWRVRFTPTEVGTYTWQLSLRDRTGQVTGGEGSFKATKPRSKGFVRTSKIDPHYLAFDNGEGYFAIGHNLPIYHTTGQLGHEAMRKFAEAKENFNRWWMCSYGFGIEGMEKLGWYRQDAAARIDLVLDVARGLGLYYMMCMDTHQDFREGGWERNPFNARNGGPCQKAGDWFTNETARALYKKRLRYTVARWGYSPNVLCWEFGNEFEGWADSPDDIKLPWHREMSDHLRSIDPFGHLITTSFWSHTGPPRFWELPNIGIVQTHLYTNDDGNVALPVREMSLQQWRSFAKPHIFGEFGIRSHTTTEEKDPKGWGIHNALWAGLFSFCAGGPMPWWHENYIDPLNLYFHFTALANFTEGLPLGTAKWELLETSPPEFVDKNRVPETRDAVIIPLGRWGKPEQNEFVALPDGTIEGDRRPQDLLHGEGHTDLRNEPTFAVNYPKPGQFIAHVTVVSNSGLLRIWVDDELKLEKDFPCAEGLGKESVWREEWKLWETTYDEDVAVDVPAGRHRIRIENFGKDWVRVTRYTFTGCKVLDKPNLLVCGMETDGLAILWLQNKDSDWYNHGGNGKVGQVDPCTVTLQGLPDGRYSLEWWETWKGALERKETVTVKDGRLPVSVPALETDAALKLKRP
jgi:hypothetical protein